MTTQYDLAQWLFQQIEMRTSPCETRDACLELMAECVKVVSIDAELIEEALFHRGIEDAAERAAHEEHLRFQLERHHNRQQSTAKAVATRAARKVSQGLGS